MKTSSLPEPDSRSASLLPWLIPWTISIVAVIAMAVANVHLGRRVTSLEHQANQDRSAINACSRLISRLDVRSRVDALEYWALPRTNTTPAVHHLLPARNVSPSNYSGDVNLGWRKFDGGWTNWTTGTVIFTNTYFTE